VQQPIKQRTQQLQLEVVEHWYIPALFVHTVRWYDLVGSAGLQLRLVSGLVSFVPF